MQINGIIAEYNPFHKGHLYQLNDARHSLNADYTIIVMSGNFVQRGAPALLNKYKRTEMALQNGADLVLELPMYYATSSAEYFAQGAVSLLDKLGVVDHLCFGSECGDISILKRIAQILAEEPESYSTLLRQHLKEGISYPTARARALLSYEPSLQKHSDTLSSPNNILGIEYLKALLRRQSRIRPYTTTRKGSDYNDESLNHNQCSALAIRQALLGNTDMSYLKTHMPQSAYDILIDCVTTNHLLHSNDFSTVLHYKLLEEQENGYEKYLDVSSELSDRIRKNLYHFENYTGFCDLLKRKDTTHTRISRCLLHILLGITETDMNTYQAMDAIPYARVLGFRKDARPLLSAIKEHTSIPLLTKLAVAEHTLSPEGFSMLHQDIRMNTIYESIMAQKSGTKMLNEYQTPIVIL